jgi:hypothetical protein
VLARKQLAQLIERDVLLRLHRREDHGVECLDTLSAKIAALGLGRGLAGLAPNPNPTDRRRHTNPEPLRRRAA